jgi:Na+/H+ antiporter NhaD/arsenite permease-like protein
MVWALAFGTCFGGNGTLIGASANVVSAGLAESAGYPITFNAFFKIGFPTMLISVFTTNVYLIIFHVFIPWY